MLMKSRYPLTNPFFIACLIALILLPAAALKWFYPSERDALFYGIVGGLEALLALGLLIYCRSWRIWVVLALVLSIWMGFSFYVTLFGLPCSCMGGIVSFPRGTTFSLNGFMFLGACRALHYQPTHPVSFKRLIWFFGLFFIIGFCLSVVYYNLSELNF